MDVVTDRDAFVRTVRAHRTAASGAAGTTADAGTDADAAGAGSRVDVEGVAASPNGMRAPVRVPVEVRVAVDDPFAAYRRARTGDTGVFFETTGGQPGWGYFAVDPLETVSVGADPDRSALGRLAGVLARDRLVRGDCDVPYPCGVFGWLSYDVARDLEQLPESAVDDRRLPRLEAGVFDTVAAWREPRNEAVDGDAGADGDAGVDGDAGADGGEVEGGGGSTVLRVTSCPVVGEDPAASYELGLDRARALAVAALEGDGGDESAPVDATEVRFESDCTPAEFAERVRRVKHYVREGDTFQANVSQRLRAPAAVHPVKAYAALRRVNPAPYSALCEFPSCDLVSASPELLLDVDGDRLVTEPIAGTRPRGDTPEEDAALERDLTTDEKERAEHAMLVDLERNDLGKVARFGSVDVTEYRRVDRYSEVMHLVSLVEGRLRDDFDTVDAISAVFPGGTITGAPKPRTMEIIDEVEATQRGPYTGSIFAAGYDGRATLNIVIRTLVRWQDEYHLRVGAGIVHDSVPDREYDETLDKGRALVTAIDEALADTEMTVGDDGETNHEGDDAGDST